MTAFVVVALLLTTTCRVLDHRVQVALIVLCWNVTLYGLYDIHLLRQANAVCKEEARINHDGPADEEEAFVEAFCSIKLPQWRELKLLSLALWILLSYLVTQIPVSTGTHRGGMNDTALSMEDDNNTYNTLSPRNTGMFGGMGGTGGGLAELTSPWLTNGTGTPIVNNSPTGATPFTQNHAYQHL